MNYVYIFGFLDSSLCFVPLCVFKTLEDAEGFLETCEQYEDNWEFSSASFESWKNSHPIVKAGLNPEGVDSVYRIEEVPVFV